MAILNLDTYTSDGYRRFLKIKSLPSYQFRGRTAFVPDEYAHLIDLAKSNANEIKYEPIPGLFDYQQDIARTAICKRKYAVFADCGLGKTLILSEFIRHAAASLPIERKLLIVSPIMVVTQTIVEIQKWYGDSLTVEFVPASKLAGWMESAEGPRIAITNYDALTQDVTQGRIGCLVLDESSMLKSHYGAWASHCVRIGAGLEWKLALTGTPAPNDRIEYANHATFLDAFPTVNSFLARFFVNRGQTNERWEMKPHALRPFYLALAHWSIFLTNPATYGWKDNVATIPPIHIHIHDVEMTESQNQQSRALHGELFVNRVGGIGSRAKLARVAKGGDTLKPAFIRDMIATWPNESTIVWCRFNDEQDKLAETIPGAASISGSTKHVNRMKILDDFKAGQIKVIVTKPKILGFGLNLQIATRQVFSSLHDCYDESTEILTRDGWVGFDQLTTDHEVGTVNPSTLELEWQRPTRTVWAEYSGPMIRFVGQRNFDLLVTPNHRMFVKRCTTRFPSDKGGWHFRYANELAESFRRQEFRMQSFPLGGFRGESPDSITNSVEAPTDRHAHTKTIAVLRTDQAVRLAAWYLTEGHCRPIGSPEFGRITICQTEKNPENRHEIIELLRSIAGHVDEKTKDIKCYSRHLAMWLIREFGHGAHFKSIPLWLKNLDASHLTTLRDTMMKGDGISHGTAYRTASERLANDFQEICLKTGYRASVKRRVGVCAAYQNDVIFDVSIARRNTQPAIQVAPRVEDYVGMIGCATVANGTLIVRRNGIPVVSGNSYEEYYQAVKRSNRVGSTLPLNVHIPVMEIERPMAENVLRKAAMIQKDTEEQERIFNNARIG